MFLYRILKKLEYKTNFFIDFPSYPLWNKMVAMTLPKFDPGIEFHFDQLFKKKYPIKKEKILLIGNASAKLKYGSKIDVFHGDIARFNRFQNSHEEYLGKKTTLWFIAKSMFDERNYYSNNIENISYAHPNIKVQLFTTLNSESKFFKKNQSIIEKNMINVMDTESIIPILKNFTKQYIQQNGKLINQNDDFLISNGYLKPSTGLLAIMDSIIHYDEVFIHNFDFFKSNHYWGKNLDYNRNQNNGRYYNGIDVDLQIGLHEFLFEENLIDKMIANGIVKWLS
tara:strand:- start:200 stop:1045 length:846 start_codon:yes stop_codon:yes gene_type:complete